ncbi:MAG TPA: hypothetical protein VFX65_04330 [Candidatus Limnocylindrales bacterium]|nr:hypothetical protein [Candidatus Limnocylindrales bacterium]
MSTERDVTRIVRSWLAEGVTTLPDRVLDDVLDRVPATPQRRSWWPARRFAKMNNLARLAIAAAAVVVVAVAGYNMLPDSAGPSGPNASPSVSPSLVPSPTPTSSGTTRVHDGPGVLEPGRWAMDIGTVRVFFEVPNGWQENVVPDVIWHRNSDARFSFDYVDNLYAAPCAPTGLKEPPVGPTVDDLATALTSMPGIEATGPTDVAMGGFEGKLVEFNLTDANSPCQDGVFLWKIASFSEQVPLDTNARTRVWILDVDGSRLVVSAVERSGLASTVRAQLRQILDSVEIEP